MPTAIANDWIRVDDVVDYLKPANDGDAVRLYDSTGEHWIQIRSTAGNRQIQTGTDTSDGQQFRWDAPTTLLTLRGLTASEWFKIENNVDGVIFEVFANNTISLHGNTTLESGSFLRGTTGQDIGTTLAPFDQMFAESFVAKNPGFVFQSTTLDDQSLANVGATFAISGGQGLEFSITQDLSAAVESSFLGNSGTQRHDVAATFGSNPVTGTKCIIGHNGTDAFVTCGAGALNLSPRTGRTVANDTLAFNPRTTNPGALVDGELWYREDTDVLHLRANGATETILTDVNFPDREFDAYDAAGGTDISGGFTDVPLDTEREETADFSHTGSSASVTINTAGKYLVTYAVTAEITFAGTETRAESKLQVDTGGGFADLAGTLSACELGLSAAPGGTMTRTLIYDAAAGDVLKIQAQRSSGTATVELVASGSSLTIRRTG